jgi:hypothetical protein
MKYGGLGVLALLLIIAIALALLREHAPISKVCKVTYNDNTVATYECRYVDVQKSRIVVGTKDGDVNIPLSCVKMFTTKEKKEGGSL